MISTKKDNRILLVEPSCYRLFKNTYSLDQYPLSLGYLAGTIKREARWDVMAYNFGFSLRSDVMSVQYLANEGFNSYLNNPRNLSQPSWKEIRLAIEAFRFLEIDINTKCYSQDLIKIYI